MNIKIKQQKWHRRHKRVKAKLFGTVEKPRLCVFKSNKHIYVQLIDDEKAKTLLALSDKNIKSRNVSDLGELIAKKAEEKKIKKIVFDRGGYQYHGQIKALAEGARKGGLEF